MRRVIHCLVIACVFILVIAIFIKPAILFLAKRQLRNIFIDSVVTIGSCELRPLRQLSLSDIQISKNRIYDFKVKEIRIEYTPFSIMRRIILKFSLSDATIMVDLPQNSIRELNKLLSLKTETGMFLVRGLELSGVNLDLYSKDLSLKAHLSSELNLINQLIDYFDLRVVFLEGNGLQLNNGSIRAAQRSAQGLLYIGRLKYNKVIIERIRSEARLKRKSLHLDSLSARILGGDVQGDLSLQLTKGGECLIGLKFANLDLDTLVKDFNLSEKIQISGKIGGIILLSADGFDINFLSGNFTAAKPGGLLTIKDTSYLEKIVQDSSQSLDLLVESFKNYHYNMGIMKLSFDKGNLILDIALDGESGRRNLNVKLHDFELIRRKK